MRFNLEDLLKNRRNLLFPSWNSLSLTAASRVSLSCSNLWNSSVNLNEKKWLIANKLCNRVLKIDMCDLVCCHSFLGRKCHLQRFECIRISKWTWKQMPTNAKKVITKKEWRHSLICFIQMTSHFRICLITFTFIVNIAYC